MSAAAVLLSLLLVLLAAQAAAATLTITWAPNSEPDLAGYRIYYGAASGSYGDPVTVGPAATRHQLSGLEAATTYYVAMSAFDYSGNESGFSNEASATTLGGWWPSYRHEPGEAPARRPWWGTHSPRPAQPPVRRPWWPGYRKGAP